VTRQWRRFAYHLAVSLSYSAAYCQAAERLRQGGNEEVMVAIGEGEERRKARSRKKM
jgi:hypothetical protein